MERLGVGDVDSAQPEPGVTLSQLIAGERMNIQEVAFEPGSVASEHSHPNEQVTFVYEGTLTIHGEDGSHELEAGDSLLIPGGATHSAENTGDTVARAVDVFGPPREGTPWDDE